MCLATSARRHAKFDVLGLFVGDDDALCRMRRKDVSAAWRTIGLSEGVGVLLLGDLKTLPIL